MKLQRIKINKIKSADKFEDIFIESEYKSSPYVPKVPLPIFIQTFSDRIVVWYGKKAIDSLSPNQNYVTVYTFSPSDSILSIIQQITCFIQLTRDLYPIEIAKITQIVATYSEKQELELLFPKLFPHRSFSEWISIYPKILSLNTKLINYLVKHKAPLKIWLGVTEWLERDQNILVEILDYYHPTLSQFIILNRYLRELCDLKQISLNDLRSEIIPAGSDTELKTQTSITAESLIEKLYTLRFPHISEHNQRLLKLQEGLKLSKKLKITWDQTFEKRELKIALELNRIDDLKLIGELNSPKNKAILKQMLELL